MINISGKAKDLIGLTFGDWTVLKRAQTSNKHPYWTCKCLCGNVKDVRGDHLTNGRSKSCGKCTSLYSTKYNLIGQKFCKLQVINYDQQRSLEHGRAYFVTKCDCGTIKSYRASQLLDGSAKSCGCLRSSLEELVSSVLNKYKIEYKREYSFPNLYDKKLLYFDFAIFSDNVLIGLIECNGQQHYMPIEHFGGQEQFIIQQKHDQMKSNYCKKNNIPLFILKYNNCTEQEVIQCLISLNLLIH